MLNFDNCIVLVNGTGIICENASINSTNELLPVYSIGRQGVSDTVPNGPINTSFNLSYYPDLKKEVIFSQLNTIKTITADNLYSGISIIVGGITGKHCYLQNFTINAQPNDTLTANATFISYFQPVGDLLKLRKITGSFQNFGHGWTTFVGGSGNINTFPTYELNYNFGAEWQPTYILGRVTPIQTNLLSATERLDLLIDKYYNIEFSGDSVCNKLLSGNNCSGINFSGLGMLCSSSMTGSGYHGSLALQNNNGIFIPISGFIINSTIVQGQTNDVIRVRTSMIKAF